MKCAVCSTRARRGSKRDAIPLCESCGGRLDERTVKPANENAGLTTFWHEIHPVRRFPQPGFSR